MIYIKSYSIKIYKNHVQLKSTDSIKIYKKYILFNKGLQISLIQLRSTKNNSYLIKIYKKVDHIQLRSTKRRSYSIKIYKKVDRI